MQTATYDQIFLAARESLIGEIVKRNRKTKKTINLFRFSSLDKLAERLEKPIEDENKDFLASIKTIKQDDLQCEVINQVFEGDGF